MYKKIFNMMSSKTALGTVAGLATGVAAAAAVGFAPMMIMFPGVFAISGGLMGAIADVQQDRRQALPFLYKR